MVYTLKCVHLFFVFGFFVCLFFSFNPIFNITVEILSISIILLLLFPWLRFPREKWQIKGQVYVFNFNKYLLPKPSWKFPFSPVINKSAHFLTSPLAIYICTFYFLLSQPVGILSTSPGLFWPCWFLSSHPPPNKDILRGFWLSKEARRIVLEYIGK